MSDIDRPRDNWKPWAMIFGVGCVALIVTTCLLAFSNRSEAEKLRERLGKMEAVAAQAQKVEAQYEDVLHERSQERVARYDLEKKTARLTAAVERLDSGLAEALKSLALARNERDEYFAELTALQRRHDDALSLLVSASGSEERVAELTRVNADLRRRLADLSKRAKDLLTRLAEVRAELTE